MYKHCEDKDEYISLHDCYATKMEMQDGILSFCFPDGFWVGEGHPHNFFKKLVRTGESRVKFRLEHNDGYDVTIYIFTREKDGKTIREECDFEKFADAINNGSYRLEFLYSYKGYNTIKYDCWLWFDEEPRHKECELTVSTDKVSYCWNELCEDKPW